MLTHDKNHKLMLDRPRARRINDAAHALGVSRTTIYNMAAAEKLKLVKVGGRTLVPETEIDRLIEGT